MTVLHTLKEMNYTTVLALSCPIDFLSGLPVALLYYMKQRDRANFPNCRPIRGKNFIVHCSTYVHVHSIGSIVFYRRLILIIVFPWALVSGV